MINESVFSFYRTLREPPHTHLLLYDKQRKGVPESISSQLGEFQHIEMALRRASPFNKITTLPIDVLLSLDVIRNSESNDIFAFWDVRWREIKELPGYPEPVSTAWYCQTPECISPATGAVHIARLSALMGNYGMGGRDWLPQFIYGFPFAGYRSQFGVFGETDKILPSVLPPPDCYSMGPRCASAIDLHIQPR